MSMLEMFLSGVGIVVVFVLTMIFTLVCVVGLIHAVAYLTAGN